VSARRGRPARWAALALLAAAVLLVHLRLADALLVDRFGFGASAEPRRIEVAFVQELKPAAPAPVPAPEPAPAPAAVAPAAAAAKLPSRAASAPTAGERADDAAAEPATRVLAALPAAADATPVAAAASAPVPMLEPVAPVAATTAPALPALPALGAPVFDWPPSTRLSYLLTGHFQGPVEGQARVEWLAEGARYQVHLEVSVGPPFAPLLTRRISSDGLITAEGLAPRRYDEVTEAVLRDPRRFEIHFDEREVRLPSGEIVPRPDGVQDSASQFVHLTWLFATRPGLLQPGRSIELPLALPRRVAVWTYDVMEEQTISTPVGEIGAVQVRPRRESRRGAELTAEVWVAPSLQNLPVRIVIRQDANTWIDLMLARLPQQAAR
jgi:hypothetical protein